MAGLIAGFAGPFGSFSANIFSRLAFWTSLFWIGTFLLWPSVSVAIAWGERKHIPTRLSGGVAVMAACVPLALLAAGGGHILWPLHASGMRALEWYCQTLLVALPMTAAIYWFEIGALSRFTSTLADDRDKAAPSFELADRTTTIPDHVMERALCLQMEDHHIRVHGDGRSTLHLSTMQEAVRRVGDQRGLQVHRSWWVARDAIQSIEEGDRSVTLLLRNGVRVPVARNRIALLRQQGWLTASRETVN